MKANELTQERFPFICGDRENPILQKCREFLEWKIDPPTFEDFIISKNTELTQEDERLYWLYQSWAFGRPWIMDGAPEYAQAFRLEIIQILDGERPKWE